MQKEPSSKIKFGGRLRVPLRNRTCLDAADAREMTPRAARTDRQGIHRVQTE